MMTDDPRANIISSSKKRWNRPTIEEEKRMPIRRLLTKHLVFSYASKETLAEIHRNVKNVRDDLRYHSFWDQSWGNRVFRGKVASLAEIKSFLYDSPLYDNEGNRWRHISREAITEHELHVPFIELITAVLKHFGGFGNRSVNLSRNEAMFDPTIINEEKEVFKLVPDITIKGTGRNFSPNDGAGAGTLTSTYICCVTPIEIATVRKVSKGFEHYLVQMAHYARQCFIEQDNRIFVYTLLLNEKYTHVCCFDRSGAHISGPINIDLKPHLLVRFILGVCSTRDDIVGFDTDMFWNSDKTKRFIATINKRHEPVCYELVDTRPVFRSRSLRGVGTRFWSARNSNGGMLLIKDTWCTTGDLPEEGFLEAAEEFVALGTMIASQQGGLVSSIRDFSYAATPLHQKNFFWDQVFCRTTFEDSSLSHISTHQEFLSYVRSVIAGNQSLWEGALLYHCINFNSFLANAKENPAGEPGMIDMNLSFWLNRSTSLLGSRVRPQSPAFYSINELLAGAGESLIPHDHLDDIESVFYALCWITIGNVDLNDTVAHIPSCISDWDSPNPKVAALSKQATFLLDEFLPAQQVSPFFGQVFQHLLGQMHLFLRPHIVRKLLSAKLDIVQPIVSSAVDDYAAILGLVDDALEQLCAAIDEIPEPHSQVLLDKSNVITPSPSTPKKRTSETEKYGADRATNGIKRPKKHPNLVTGSFSQRRR